MRCCLHGQHEDTTDTADLADAADIVETLDTANIVETAATAATAATRAVLSPGACLLAIAMALHVTVRFCRPLAETPRTRHEFGPGTCFLRTFMTVVGQGWASTPDSLPARIVAISGWMLGKKVKGFSIFTFLGLHIVGFMACVNRVCVSTLQPHRLYNTRSTDASTQWVRQQKYKIHSHRTVTVLCLQLIQYHKLHRLVGMQLHTYYGRERNQERQAATVPGSSTASVYIAK